MLKYILIASAAAFSLRHGWVINANPVAQKLYEVYQPIARTSVNAPVGIAVDLVYGLVMAGLFVVLYESLPARPAG